MSTLRQSLFFSCLLFVLLVCAAIVAEITIHVAFTNSTKAELEARFRVISEDIDANGFDPEKISSYSDEVVFFQADPTSAAAAPEGIFEMRGAIDDDFVEDDWYYFVGEVAGSVLAVGAYMHYSASLDDAVSATIASIGLVVVVLAMAMGFALSLRTQKRLSRISEVLARVSEGDLGSRINSPTSRDDLDDLAGDVDRTVERLEVLFHQTRNLSVNIAHDLKTPLARLRLRLENALLSEDADRASEDIAEALEQTDRVIAIFDAYMRIARLESSDIGERLSDVDLATLTEDIAATFGPVIEDAGFRFELENDSNKTIKGDPVLLTQMLGNLLENAMRYTPQGTRIKLFSDDNALGVADEGPGIPEDQRDEVVKPSVRLDQSRSAQGAGLGLALVKTIADAHEAELQLSENPASKSPGLIAKIIF